MKTYPVHTRSYVLVGELIAEYRGKSAGSMVKDIIEFDIEVYKAKIHHARVVDASFLDCIVEGQTAQALSLDCPITVSPRNSSEQFTISPREATVYGTSLEGVSEIGGEVYGTLHALVVFPVEEKTFRLNPISIPTASINGTFPGYVNRPAIKTDGEEPEEKKPSFSLKPLIDGLFQFLGWLLLFFLVLAFFSAISPVLLLILFGIAVIALLIEILPQAISSRISSTLRAIATALFYLIGGAFVLWLGYAIIGNLLTLSLFWLPLVGLLMTIGYIFGNLRSLSKVVSVLGLFALALSIPVLLTLSPSSNSSSAGTTYNPVPRQAPTPVETAPVEVVKTQPQNDTAVITQTLTWSDYDGERYQITYDLNPIDIRASKNKREQADIRMASNRDFGVLFQNILQNERSHLTSFITQLDSIRTSNNLAPKAFADVVVSLVQQLDYTLLFEQACPITNLPCKQGIRYGVYTPTEFLYILQGDCDTKTLLVYLVLREFDYDVAIMGSVFYQHAMLALDLPTDRGAAMLYENDAFYVWEVTAPGWRLGELPPESNQLQFWDIILAQNNY